MEVSTLQQPRPESLRLHLPLELQHRLRAAPSRILPEWCVAGWRGVVCGWLAQSGVRRREALRGVCRREALSGVRQREALSGVRQREALSGVRQREALSGVRQREALRGVRQREALRGVRQREALRGARPWCVQCSVPLDGLRGCSQRVSAPLAETSFAELHLQLCICLSSSDRLSSLPGAGILVRPELGAGGSGRLRFAATCCFCWTELTVARLPPIRGGQAVELVCGGCPGGLVSSVAMVVWQRARDWISRNNQMIEDGIQSGPIQICPRPSL
ncbi:uncharacterized protein LOC122377863 [Amphibalanus amphitrite]|uniref:uncharacterized protein LOC122377863 n=1 Tax=Amphibalanus amphitrite TaxID=1232801 RepID=UPI001C925CF3|nr:uncharacterized protein LOC122377863 [Amphibalanus amphitrite]